eukprot:TRINITY_DN98_c0_g1_i1.p2 TRINITY_DN98_c0_g1~~TRINITY_DN98_c0_g1_i1.p2  ORF type:complete len:154 (-),score=58.55 TRINITY_DN98_c0_g1_i1:181-642(-)
MASIQEQKPSELKEVAVPQTNGAPGHYKVAYKIKEAAIRMMNGASNEQQEVEKPCLIQPQACDGKLVAAANDKKMEKEKKGAHEELGNKGGDSNHAIVTKSVKAEHKIKEKKKKINKKKKKNKDKDSSSSSNSSSESDSDDEKKKKKEKKKNK